MAGGAGQGKKGQEKRSPGVLGRVGGREGGPDAWCCCGPRPVSGMFRFSNPLSCWGCAPLGPVLLSVPVCLVSVSLPALHCVALRRVAPGVRGLWCDGDQVCVSPPPVPSHLDLTRVQGSRTPKKWFPLRVISQMAQETSPRALVGANNAARTKAAHRDYSGTTQVMAGGVCSLVPGGWDVDRGSCPRGSAVRIGELFV
jgi:hypothetical protein